MDEPDHIERLQATLARRDTPETVVKLIRDAMPVARYPDLHPRLGEILASSVGHFFGWSSMASTFAAVGTPARRVEKARELAFLFLPGLRPDALPFPAGQADTPAAFDEFITDFEGLIGKTPGRSNFVTDRLDRGSRKALGVSRRRYAKLFRMAQRLEDKRSQQDKGEALRNLTLVAKAALAPRLNVADFAGDVATAAFIAYYTARMKLRSEFTISGQQRPFDDMSAALFKICEASPTTQWRAIAHVFPRADVLEHLPESERGQLLGIWFDILQQLADRLDTVRQRTDINVATMVVKRGNDSSTWNLLAGAWNQARDHWLALVTALNMDALFDTVLPGKVMKLVAADVAAWHAMSGKGLHPDTQVWKALPPPWQVLRGEAICTRAEVASACAAAGIDPETTGWTAPRPRTAIQAFRPTPELVHGVTVSNPYLADYLRRRGVFSGKPLKPAPAEKDT